MFRDFRFHHIGYAVKNIDQTASHYLEGGWELSAPITDPIQNVRIAFLTKAGHPSIELVTPVNAQSPVVKTLEKSGVSPYHVCYEVNDIEQAVAMMRNKHFIPLFKPVAAVALGSRKICYLYNRHVGLVELLNKD